LDFLEEPLLFFLEELDKSTVLVILVLELISCDTSAVASAPTSPARTASNAYAFLGNVVIT